MSINNWADGDDKPSHVISNVQASGTRMSWIDLLGFVASAMVLATFCMSRMLPLRVFAIGSNLLFGAYGYLDHLYPVLLLHLVLLPINCVRLCQFLRGPPPPRTVLSAPANNDFGRVPNGSLTIN